MRDWCYFCAPHKWPQCDRSNTQCLACKKDPPSEKSPILRFTQRISPSLPDQGLSRLNTYFEHEVHCCKCEA